MTNPVRRKIKKQAWLWTNEVGEYVLGKKRLYHGFLRDKTADDWRIYQEAKAAAKKVVDVAKPAHYDDLKKKLETRDDKRRLYRLAKAHHGQTEDIKKFSLMFLMKNDESGHVPTNRKRAMKRWHEYFERIPTSAYNLCPPAHGHMQNIIV
ncbi:unnamed protein product [Heligmosomoides polygyrus]|uniref:50S ribosomal protein L20 n=1 Tax=Heligmosomoides polygyrus TaxID=6339 RepID=A0A183G5D9_HELPZ|nr:unnamed protein product [Heligmosomoides polygyrus]